MNTVQEGNTVEVHYVGTFEDGTEFDSSHSRDKTISFEVGSGQMISGFDSAVIGMSVGETKEITLSPEDAYGVTNTEHLKVYPKSAFPDEVQLSEGVSIAGQNELGQQLVAKILKVEEDTVLLDFNHHQ